MIGCRSLIRADHAWKFTNSVVISKPVQFIQVCNFHRGLKHKCEIGGVKDRQGVMDHKRQKTVTPIWRPVCTQSSSDQECMPKVPQVEIEDLDEVDDGGKLEDGSQAQEVHHGVSRRVLDAQYVREEGDSANRPADPTFSAGTIQDTGEGRAQEGELIPSDKKHTISLEVGASLMRFIKGKGGSTQKHIEEEMGVKIIFPSSKKEDAIIIEGVSVESVTRASERVQVIIDEAVQSRNLDYSHFISLPLAIHPELVDKLVNFQKSILGISNRSEDVNWDSDSNGDTSEDDDENQELDRVPDVAVKLKVEDNNERVKVDITNVKVDVTNVRRVSYQPKALKPSALNSSKLSASSEGIERSIFTKPKTFHLTILMLKLWNKDRVDTAAKVLQSVSSKVLEALDSRPVSVRLKGLECMRGSLAKARVVYAPVEEIGSEGRLLLACQAIIDAFIEADLVLEKDVQQKLKLHATVMNARHRKRKKGTRKLDSFDARGIFKQFGSEEWGEYLIREAHLSQRVSFCFLGDLTIYLKLAMWSNKFHSQVSVRCLLCTLTSHLPRLVGYVIRNLLLDAR